MEAGLHVYCESMMAHTLDAARDIVRASERTGKLCQIGHQHRSHAIYQYTRDRLLYKHRICENNATLRIAGAGEHTEIRNRTSGDESGVKLAQLRKRGIIRVPERYPCYLQQENEDSEMGVLAHESTPPIPYELPGKAPRPALESHLIYFFDAIHGRAELNCDARTAFQSEAAMYWLNAAGESGETHRFTAEQLAA